MRKEFSISLVNLTMSVEDGQNLDHLENTLKTPFWKFTFLTIKNINHNFHSVPRVTGDSINLQFLQCSSYQRICFWAFWYSGLDRTPQAVLQRWRGLDEDNLCACNGNSLRSPPGTFCNLVRLARAIHDRLHHSVRSLFLLYFPSQQDDSIPLVSTHTFPQNLRRYILFLLGGDTLV